MTHLAVAAAAAFPLLSRELSSTTQPQLLLPVLPYDHFP